MSDHTLPLFSLQEETKEIPLTRGKVAIVDAADFEWLTRQAWQCSIKGYATAQIRVDGVYKTVRMHRLITGAPSGTFVDHINRNRLDNRRANLRLATPQQSACNSVVPPGKVPYRGVKLDERGNRPNPYEAYIKANGRKIYLGCFATAEEAARARDVAACELHGEFAVFNFPGEIYSEEYKRKIREAVQGRKESPRTEEYKWTQRKLTPEQLAEFRVLREQGWALARLARHFGISPSSAQRIAVGETYREGTL